MTRSIAKNQYIQLETPDADAPELIQHALELIRQYVSGSDAFSFFTSGTTGKPRSISFSRSQLRAGILRTIKQLHLTSDDRFYSCLSPETTGGAMLLYRAAELQAALTIAIPHSDPLSDLTSVHDYSVISLAPIQLFKGIGSRDYLEKLNRFRVILIGGAPVSPQLEIWLTPCTATCYETYGMTETASHIALRRIGSETAFTIFDGIDARTDDRNCLCVRADITGNDWVITNDVIEWIGERQFIVKGRADLVVNTGGIKVHPEVTERIMQQFFQDLHCFVAGVPDDRLGQRLTLFTEGDHGIDKQDLHHLLSAYLPPYHVPVQVISVDRFTYTKSGKIDRLATVQAAGY